MAYKLFMYRGGHSRCSACKQPLAKGEMIYMNFKSRKVHKGCIDFQKRAEISQVRRLLVTS
jgi:hypothetical protein